MKNEMQPTMKQLRLDHYATREPREFHQIDLWGDETRGDSCIDPGGAGMGMTVGGTTELMHGPEIARVLIPIGAPRAKIVAQLRHAADAVDAGILDEECPL